jgi:D-beta-D-heptose 7-phosphate kinase / D-beta-D-heptose 1-phosphate adenosyltransferase
MSTAVDFVRHFRQLRALVIGDAMLDTYLEGTAARLCREGPVPVVRKMGEHRIPGGAANTAANLRALDAEVFFLSIVGQDMTGAALRSSLREPNSFCSPVWGAAKRVSFLFKKSNFS